MKGRVIEKTAAIVCALCLAVGVMGNAVFARDEDIPSSGEAVQESVSPADLAEETSEELDFFSGEANWEVITPTPGATPEVIDNRTEVPLLLDGEQCGVCTFVGGVPCAAAADFFRTLGVTVDGGSTGDGYELRGEVDMSVPAEGSYVVCNGRYFLVEDGVQYRDGQALIPLGVLAEAAGVSLSWDRARWTVTIQRDGTPMQTGDEYYAESDVYWLSRIISAEAGSLSLTLPEQIAVGDVVLNRVNSTLFPGQNNVYDAIFAKNAFDVVINGMVYMDPDEEAVIAAKLALEGYDLTDGATYYDTRDYGEGYDCVCWVGGLCLMNEA